VIAENNYFGIREIKTNLLNKIIKLIKIWLGFVFLFFFFHVTFFTNANVSFPCVQREGRVRSK